MRFGGSVAETRRGACGELRKKGAVWRAEKKGAVWSAEKKGAVWGQERRGSRVGRGRRASRGRLDPRGPGAPKGCRACQVTCLLSFPFYLVVAVVVGGEGVV